MGRAPSRRTVDGAAPFRAALLAVLLCALPDAALAGRVSSHLDALLAKTPPDQRVPIIVELEERANPASAAAEHRRDRKARGRAVVKALRDVADRSQKPVLQALAEERSNGHAGHAKAFWIFNGIATEATEKAIRRIAARKDVREVRFDAPIAPPRLKPAATPSTAAAEVMWNIELVRAPEVWALDPAYDGTGIVIGSFDTGVDVTHPDLAPRYRGNHAISWFDPYHQYSVPTDDNGHGTHTTGTALGGDASGAFIGVAPGARWIAAKGWSASGNATVSAFHQIFEWFIAPGGDPDNAPHVVNNSWGMSPPDCYLDFQPDLQAWRAAGIFSTFASGNEGPGPGTMLSPGNYPEAFAVGATDPDDLYADFSGQGPSQCDGEVKPDMSAPGVAIFSALPGDFWFELDGTSMATPHVTGAAAVLLSIDPTLGVDELESALALGAQDVEDPGVDNLTGVGRLDLLNSARIVLGVPMVGVRATGEANEAGTVAGRFTVTRTEPMTDELTLTYTVGGSATSGTDYVALAGSVTLPAGVASVDITVAPIDDALVELDETVVLTLDTAAGLIVSPAGASVRIASDEPVPDLTVSALTVPWLLGADIPFTVNETTANIGPGVTPATSTRFYLSTDTTWSAGDILLGTRAVPPLAGGASSSGSLTLTIPALTPGGYYYLIARADVDAATVELSEDNNTQARAVLVGPELSIADLATPAAGAGQPLTVTVTTRNLGGGGAPATVTRFYLSANSALDASDVVLGNRSVPALAPGASDAGTATFTIPAGTASGGYYLLARADADDVVSETSETNNVFARPLYVGADLAIASFTPPTAAGAGLAITLTETTRNLGGGSAPATTTRLYLSTNAVLDAGDTALGSRAVPALAPGASHTGSTAVTIPAATPTGYYYLVAKADGDDTLAETNELNNASAVSIAIGPDLALLAITAPAGAAAGQAIAVGDTTRNQGGGAAPASTTRFYLSTNGSLDAADIALGSRSLAGIAPGASDTGSITVTIPAGTTSGSYFILARADGADAIAEINENNNVFYRAINIGPDLVMNALGVPASSGPGLAITVTDTTANASGGAATASTTRFYLSADGTLDAADVLLGARAVPALAGGASSAGSTSVVIPAGTVAGAYQVIAKADGDDSLSETSEANNLRTAAINIGPDLAIVDLTAPAGGAGLPMTVSVTTRNQGGSGAGATVTRFYLSSNTALDAADVVLGGRGVPALAVGASDIGTATFTIPAGTASGAYYLLAKADGDDSLPEASEGNNVLARAIAIGGDLVVSALTAPGQAGAGAAFTLTDTTQNIGGGTTPATTTRFYLSSNATLDGGDVPLGARAVPALAASASHAAATTLSIPAGTATGSYYLIAKADGDEVFGETSEANNTRAATMIVGPDLAVGALTVPATAGAGQPMTVTDTTRNLSGGAAPATTTRFYLSTDGTLDAADVPLGQRSVAALAPNASDTASTSLVVPPGTPARIYYVIAKADGDDAVLEANESNNTLLRTVAVGSDLVVTALNMPAAAAAGETITVADTTMNAGGGTTAPTVTRLYLSLNGALDASDTLLGSRSVASLGAGAVDTGSVVLTLPAGLAAGSYYVIARADSDDALVETYENNNTLARLLTIGPDLVVSSLTAPAGGAGQPLAVTVTTRNQGGGTTPPTSTRFYLSSNSALDAGDVFLGSRSVPALSSGAADTGSETLVIPAGTASGTWYVFARADGDDAVVETSETNNVRANSISIGPDLAVTAIALPYSVAAGATFTANDTTTNQGGGHAPATVTRYYLSANTLLDAGDPFLGSRSVGSVAAGTSNAGPATLTIPAGTAAGAYYLIAKADSDNAVGETSEANNAWVVVLRVTP